MKLPPEVLALLARRFEGNHREWLAQSAEGAWPMAIPLGVPTEAQAMREVDAVRAWVQAWRAWSGAGEVEWVSRQWKVLGAQRLPAMLRLDSPHALARCINQSERWSKAENRFRTLVERWPSLQARQGRLFGVLADYADDDFQRLQDMLTWLEANPHSGLYPRQIPVAGLDSKWLEGRMGVLRELIGLVHASGDGTTDFYELCGLKKKPVLMRIRLLDPALRAACGGLGDVTAPVPELARLALAPQTVLIVENLQTGLALPDLPGTVAVMGLGFSVDLLACMPWVQQARGLYWGDIDSHGFAILNRARTVLPTLRSILMDEETLMAARPLWTAEALPHAAKSLALLTVDEAAVYSGLKSNRWAQDLRLEQERIEWSFALQRITAAVN